MDTDCEMSTKHSDCPTTPHTCIVDKSMCIVLRPENSEGGTDHSKVATTDDKSGSNVYSEEETVCSCEVAARERIEMANILLV